MNNMSKMKVLVLVPIGGLANRFYAISSAISFCQMYGIRLHVIWFKDWGMGADFHSLLDLAPILSNIKVVDAHWQDYIYDRPRKRNFWLPYLYQKVAFPERFYEKDIYNRFSVESLLNSFQKHDSVYLVQFRSFYKNEITFKCLSPIKPIQQQIDERTKFFEDKHVIGMHIRRGDHTTPTLGSPLSLFISKIEEEVTLDPKTYFYVASDSFSEKKKLKDLFGERIITRFDEVRRDNESGIVDALVELYTLAHTSKIYGSLASSYSSLAAELYSIKLEILSLV